MYDSELVKIMTKQLNRMQATEIFQFAANALKKCTEIPKKHLNNLNLLLSAVKLVGAPPTSK